MYCTKDFDSKKIKFIVGGDDILVVLDNGINSNDVREKMLKRSLKIGQIFKFLIVKSFKSENIIDRPCFYKYTIDRNEPVVYPTALLERMMMPWNKKYYSNFKIFTRSNPIIRSANKFSPSFL